MKMNIKVLLFNLNLLFIILNLKMCNSSHIFDIMTDDEFYRVFRTDRSQVPPHEFVKISTVSNTQFKRRLSIRNRFLSFSVFGRKYEVELKLRDNVLLGKNTPIWIAETNPNSSLTEYSLLTNILDNVNGIYQDTTNMVSLLETKIRKNGEVLYNGMIGTELAISPLPQRLINIMANMNNDTNGKDHIIFKISADNSTSDDDTPLAQLRQGHFTIFTQLYPLVNFYTLISEMDIARKYIKKEMRLQPLEILYPELLIVVDASLYRRLGQQPHFAMNYLVPFWNGVDLRYRLLETPEVKINIAGVILAQDEDALRFLSNNLDETGRIQAKKALLDAGEYFETNEKFKISKDMIVIMTKRDICSTKYASYCKSSAVGKAFTGKACSKKKNTAILEDNGGYAGIITATHEIGHLLGLPHDGEEEASNCPIKDGYIMASAKFRSMNSLCWSTCSKQILEQFASFTASNCLENRPANLGELIVQNLPGKILSLEEQCYARGGKPCIFNATVCWKLHCTKSITNMKCVGKAPAAEGSTCGDHLYCRNGECVADKTEAVYTNV